MTFHRTFRTIAGIAAVAVAIGFGSGAALAQPAALRMARMAHHGTGGPDEMIGHLIAHAKGSSISTRCSKGMFDTAVADSKAAREAGRALHEKVKATLQAELAKPEPDLAAVAAAADAAADQARDQAQGDPGRVARALRDVHGRAEGRREATCCRSSLAHAESFRQKMRERMQSEVVRLTTQKCAALAFAGNGPGFVPGPFSSVEQRSELASTRRASTGIRSRDLDRQVCRSRSSAALLSAAATTGFSSSFTPAARTSACAALLVSPDTTIAGCRRRARARSRAIASIPDWPSASRRSATIRSTVDAAAVRRGQPAPVPHPNPP